MDYEGERGAKRNTEPWRMNGWGVQESGEEMLDRLEREEEEKNTMLELETKTLDVKCEMAVADALDEECKERTSWQGWLGGHCGTGKHR